MHKSILFVALSLSSLAGCSGINHMSEADAAKVQMCKSELSVSDRVKKESLTAGCLVSVAFNKMIGSNNPVPVLCLAGGASGLVFGETINERKCHYITLEDQLDGELAHAARMNEGLVTVFARQALDLEKYKLSAQAFAEKSVDNEISREGLAAFRKQLDAELKKEQAFLMMSQKEFNFKSLTLKKSRQLKDKAKEEKLLAEIKALREGIETLQENNDKLLRLKNGLTLKRS